jgi:hypothetical protein
MADLSRPVFSKLPLGLLGFLGIKTGGAYPQFLGDSIQPTWDMLEMLSGVHVESGATVAAAPAAAAFGSYHLVPQNEVWYVRHYSARATTAAGEALAWHLAMQTPASGSALPVTHFLSNQVSVGASVVIGQFAPANAMPMFVGPGTNFGIWTNTITGAPSITTSMLLNRFPI